MSLEVKLNVLSQNYRFIKTMIIGECFMSIKRKLSSCFSSGFLLGSMLVGSTYVQADGGVKFTDIAVNEGTGIGYRRTPSQSNEIWNALKRQDVYTPEDIFITPTKAHGDPGVAIFDFDGDDDLDIYVTNGPGTANSLYSNQRIETGEVTFVDVAVVAGVDATDQDSTGVCFGDIDNDGDHDLYVLGNGEPNRLLQNMDDGTFNDITTASGTGAGNNSSSSCSFGDVNGDGRLDFAVANLFFSLDHRIPVMSLDFDHLLQHNQLFVNKGSNTFSDESEVSGIQTVPGISWAIALVDYDLDGDVDLFVADDQGARAPAKDGGRDAGLLRLYDNDGTGSFTDMTEVVDKGHFGAWMSLSFGDLNSDGNLDVFASNVGDYFPEGMRPLIDFSPALNDWSTGWFLGADDATFSFPGIGDLKATPFGWGSAIVDYDNDGDLDIIYHGGFEAGPFVDASNPGAILKNDGSANFTRDADALTGSTDHARRNVKGVAVGDLNDDGFMDIVSVSNKNWPKQAPLVPYITDPGQLFGGPFDEAAFQPTFSPIDPTDLFKGFTWNGIEHEKGTLSIEINSADNGNTGINVELLGSQGFTSKGRVNRDGIGAVVSFRPHRGKTVMKPIVSGGSHASSENMGVNFGMGSAHKGVLEVLWPGGVRNRLYRVRPDEHIVFPEIPCSFTDPSLSFREYRYCVVDSLNDLRYAGVIDRVAHRRYLRSALRAFRKPSLSPRKGQVRFEDLSEHISFSHSSNGGEGHGGAAWFDYNNDGLLDLFLSNGLGHKNGLFRNDGNGNFTDVSREAGIENGLGNSGVLAGDIDNDGYVDLFLSSAGNLFAQATSPVRLYHNNGDGTFANITENSGLSGIETSWSAAFGDINGDSFLDLLISAPGSFAMQRQDKTKLFLNTGELGFVDISELAGVDTAMGGCLAAFSDYDLDGDQDIFIGNCNDIRIVPTPIELFRNEGNLAFSNVTQEAGLLRVGAWMGFGIGDYDNDGDQDLFVTNLGTNQNLPPSATLPALYENNGNGTFTDVGEQAGVADPIWGWGTAFTDFNNDGYTDIFYTGSFPFEPFNISDDLANPGVFYLNNQDKTFTRRDSWIPVNLRDQYTTGVAAGDFDNDGFSDIIVVAGATSLDGTVFGEKVPGEPVLLRNEGNSNNWISIKTIGTESNRDGIGARVLVKTSNLTQTKEVRAGSSFLSTESRWLTFGLQNNSKLELLEIHWPSGNVERFKNIAANQTITAVEKRGITRQHHRYRKGKRVRHY